MIVSRSAYGERRKASAGVLVLQDDPSPLPFPVLPVLPVPLLPLPLPVLSQTERFPPTVFRPYHTCHYLPHTMMFSSISLAALAVALVAPSAVNAHGYVQDLTVGGKSYSGWLPFTDPCVFLPSLRAPRIQDDRLKV